MERKMETLGPLKGVYRDYWVILGFYWDNGKENGSYFRIYLGIWDRYWGGYIGVLLGIMEKKMETTIILVLYWVYRGFI